MSYRNRCPHCDNANPDTIQDNGEKPSSPDLTLLCVARVLPSEWSFGKGLPPTSDEIGADGMVPCGMQWDPNADAG